MPLGELHDASCLHQSCGALPGPLAMTVTWSSRFLLRSFASLFSHRQYAFELSRIASRFFVALQVMMHLDDLHETLQ
jgi:hypothetical protein